MSYHQPCRLNKACHPPKPPPCHPPLCTHLDSSVFIAGMATPSPMPMRARAASSVGRPWLAAHGVSAVAALHHSTPSPSTNLPPKRSAQIPPATCVRTQASGRAQNLPGGDMQELGHLKYLPGPHRTAGHEATKTPLRPAHEATIAPEKRRLHKAHGCGVPSELCFHGQDGHGHVHAVHVTAAKWHWCCTGLNNFAHPTGFMDPVMAGRACHEPADLAQCRSHLSPAAKFDHFSLEPPSHLDSYG
eukprot:1157418-Pelagomonas_calceolata.AAC.8